MSEIPIDPREQRYIKQEEAAYLKGKIIRILLLCFLVFGIGFSVGHQQGTRSSQISAEETRELWLNLTSIQEDSIEEIEQSKKAAYDDGYWTGFDNGVATGYEEAYKEGFDYGCYVIFEGMTEDELQSWWDKNTDLIRQYDISS